MISIPGYPNYSITKKGEIYSHHINRFIRQTVRTYNGSGYRRVGLLISSNPKRYKYLYVHRLVLLTFVGPCPIGMEVDHKDRDTSNNKLSNLRYVTHVDNCKNRGVGYGR